MRQAGKPRGTAKERALRLLAARWRSCAELEQRLRQAGFEVSEVLQALEDLDQSGLIDDERFAQAVVADRAGRRLSGDRHIRAVLRQKGVADEVTEVAMVAAGDESDRALALARRRAGRLAGLDPAGAYRRLYGLLLRRGFGPAVAREACRAALAEAIAETPGAEEELTSG
jgi:regulatory protein